MKEKHKIAIIHYWLVGMRGGEKVVEALCDIYPQADIYTHVYNPTKISETIKKHTIYTTSIQRLPFAKSLYKKYLNFMPRALEQLDLSDYEIIISSESGPAKGVNVPTNTYHICYCHTPMRYLWDMYNQYYDESGTIAKLFMRHSMPKLRIWDVLTSMRVDKFIANSFNVACRINRHYRRDAEIVYPPVDAKNFYISKNQGDYYLYLGEIVGYKHVDLAIETFTKMKKKLIVIGEGKLSNSKYTKNIQFKGHLSDDEVRKYLAECKALIFPSEEDFGIVPLEAMASGRPVIAYRKGGALESVKEGITGYFFNEQTDESLSAAVLKYEKNAKRFIPEQIRDYATKFDKELFQDKIKYIIETGYIEFCKQRGIS